jgi:hypothetical protein
MARALLDPAEEQLAGALQDLRAIADWTISELAASLEVNAETLRGVLFRKNRPGPLVLEKIVALVDRANPRSVGPQFYSVAQRLGAVAWELLGPPLHEDLLDSLHRRVAVYFDDLENLIGFTGVDRDEWQRFAAGAEPSSAFLEAIVRAYSEEAARVVAKDQTDAAWCKQIVAIATKAMERVLA